MLPYLGGAVGQSIAHFGFGDAAMKATRYIVVVLVILAGVAAGRWMQPVYVPVDRMIENATAYIAEEPNDPSGYYTLARIHYLAFANKAFLVGTWNQGVPPSVIPHWWWEDYLYSVRRAEAIRIALEEFGLESIDELTAENMSAFYDRVYAIEAQLSAENWQPAQPTGEQLIGHAGAAQWNFHRAIALDPNNALYYLGQASLGEQYLDYFAEASPNLMPAALKRIMLATVKETYLLTYQLSIEEDLELEFRPIEGLRGIISYEAGNAFIRLWEAEPEIPKDVQELILTIRTNLKILESLPWGAITPIVLSFQSHASLADLLAPETHVSFDLDGDGGREKRSWIKPTTGFLVWDGNGDGRVTSGREMFGSVTWWLFFPDGYRAMDVLDDNRDGWLAAGELDGISVWFDRNSNGVSDAGEVVPVARLGVEALGTRPNGCDGRSPMHTSGLRLKDGRTLPTYDWVSPGLPKDTGQRRDAL